MYRVWGVSAPPRKETVDMDTSEFIVHLQNSDMVDLDTDHLDHQFYYYSDGLFTDSSGYSGFAVLDKDLQPRDFLTVTEALGTSSSYNGSTHVWFGARHTTMHTHYDPTHNFYYQISGYKRFYILPPANIPGLRFFPFAHPGYRQSQCDEEDLALPMSSVRSQGCHLARDVVFVDLAPGDLLYFPPYMPHRVQALSLSLSINVWSPSKGSSVFARLVARQLPTLLTLADNRLRVRGLQLLCILLVRCVRFPQRCGPPCVTATTVHTEDNITREPQPSAADSLSAESFADIASTHAMAQAGAADAKAYINSQLLYPRFSGELATKLNCTKNTVELSRCPRLLVSSIEGFTEPLLRDLWGYVLGQRSEFATFRNSDKFSDLQARVDSCGDRGSFERYLQTEFKHSAQDIVRIFYCYCFAVFFIYYL